MANGRIVLIGISPEIEGLRWESEQALRIGRRPELEVVLNEASISRQHAEVRTSPHGWIVCDLGSSSGTLLNGVPVGQTPRRLQAEDVLHCGQLALRVALLQEALSPVIPPRTDNSKIKTSGVMVRVQAVAQRSWEQGLEDLGQDDQQLRQGKHFLTLLRAGYHLCRIACLNELLQSVLDDTVAVLEARRGSIVLLDEASGELRLRASAVPKGGAASGKGFSATLAQQCLTKGESLLCHDANTRNDPLRERSLEYGEMTSIICAVLRSPRQRLGLLHLDRGPEQEPFTKEDLFLADAIAASVSVGIECAQLVEKQREPFLQRVATLVRRALELRDPHTGAHGRRVGTYALMLGEELRLSPDESHQLQIGAPLHDLGKIAVDDAVLRKPSQLTQAEVEEMRAQTLQGITLAETMPELAPILPIVRSHHERWDGSGYPDGLAGEGIPRLARIVAVADAFDAMTSDQPYRAAMPLEQTFVELRAQAGRQFEPACVEAFLRLRPRLEALLSQDQARE